MDAPNDSLWETGKMNEDPFGDLRDWGNVLKILQRLAGQDSLDDVQPGLIRLIRYRRNWQIREHALLSARRIDTPSAPLLATILEVVTDRDTYPDARILAAKALAELVPKRRTDPGMEGLDRDSILQILKRQLAAPEAPVLRLAVEKAAETIERSSGVAV
jgi:hypothetical protein